MSQQTHDISRYVLLGDLFFSFYLPHCMGQITKSLASVCLLRHVRRVPEGKICKILPISNTSTVGHATLLVLQFLIELLIFGHNTLHRHTHRLTSAFLICALMSKWQPFLDVCRSRHCCCMVGRSAALADGVRQHSGRGCFVAGVVKQSDMWLFIMFYNLLFLLFSLMWIKLKY